jgi:hypothetical protein
MADLKISALTASTTPLTGTEVLPIVQSSTTKQVSVANLTAGRAVSAASVTASTGNFVVGTSGQGIDFSATPGTGTSELFADYEEGTWTPVCARSTGGAISAVYELQTGKYTKVGNLVTVSAFISITSISSQGSDENRVTGLPYTPADNSLGAGAVARNTAFTTLAIMNCFGWGDAQMRFMDNTNSGLPVSVAWKSGYLGFTFSYFV